MEGANHLDSLFEALPGIGISSDRHSWWWLSDRGRPVDLRVSRGGGGTGKGETPGGRERERGISTKRPQQIYGGDGKQNGDMIRIQGKMIEG